MNVCFNGEFFPANMPLITVQNTAYKWGDGVFETMKYYRGSLLLQDYHFERLFASLKILQIETASSFRQNNLLQNISDLCKINGCEKNGRVRLAVFRSDENSAGYSIEAFPIDVSVNDWNEQGLLIGLHPYVRKTIDAFSNLKSTSFLPYVMAKRYAEEMKLDDALILNVHNKLCDSSKANVFLVKNDIVYTPALHQGCINGVMRRKIIGIVKKLGLRLHEENVSEEELLEADEVFLTNAIQTIRWVKQYKSREYSFTLTKKIFDTLRATIY